MSQIFDEFSSAAVMEDFDNAKNLEEFLKRDKSKMPDIPLSEYINRIRREKKPSVADVIRGSGLTKSYVHQIFKGERKPPREKPIAIGFGLKLKEVEMQRMLRLGDAASFISRIQGMRRFFFCVRKGLNLDETNDVLNEHDMDIIDEEK